MQLPVYGWQKCSWSLDKLVDVLICQDVDKSKVCSMQPVHVKHNATFIVNLNSLDSENDLRADENGVWERKGSPVAYVSVHIGMEKAEEFFVVLVWVIRNIITRSLGLITGIHHHQILGV